MLGSNTLNEFDVRRNHQGDARVVRPFERFAANDWEIVVTVGSHNLTPDLGGNQRNESFHRKCRSLKEIDIAHSLPR
jgi:hypothetical protein